MAWPLHHRILLGPPFAHARLHSSGADGIDDQRGQRFARSDVNQPAQRVDEADPLDVDGDKKGDKKGTFYFLPGGEENSLQIRGNVPGKRGSIATFFWRQEGLTTRPPLVYMCHRTSSRVFSLFDNSTVPRK